MTELVFINQIFPFNDSLMLILKGNVIDLSRNVLLWLIFGS